MEKQKLQIVVVGGGFAGIKLIRSLRHEAGMHITLISDSDQFRYNPAMYRTATGYRHKESYIGIPWLLEGIKNATFVEATVTKIDRQAQVVTTEKGQNYHYDFAVIAIGMVTSYFGIPGLDRFSYGIKSIGELKMFHAHLHNELTTEHQFDKNYVVVGAGPTGVELAAALRAYLTGIARRHRVRKSQINIELIEAADRVLPAAPPRASRLVAKRLRRLGVKVMVGKKVQGETHDSLMVDGRPIPSHTVVWTAGVSNNPFFADNASQFSFNERKKVVVDEHLQVDAHTFVIGDNAATPYSGLALTAIHNAAYVARYIKNAQRDKQTESYKPLRPIAAIPAGPWWAVVMWNQMAFGGFVASLVRLLADLMGYADIMGWWRALGLWSKRSAHEESCPVCRAPQASD